MSRSSKCSDKKIKNPKQEKRQGKLDLTKLFEKLEQEDTVDTVLGKRSQVVYDREIWG